MISYWGIDHGDEVSKGLVPKFLGGGKKAAKAKAAHHEAWMAGAGKIPPPKAAPTRPANYGSIPQSTPQKAQKQSYTVRRGMGVRPGRYDQQGY